MTIVTADITGIGRISPSGLWRGKDILATGRAALRETAMDGPLPDIPMDASYPAFRRMDPYSRLGMTAIRLALQDAGLDAWTEKRNIGIIAATEYGCLNTDFDYFDTVLPDSGIGASPGLFSYTLPSSFLGDAAIRFGLTGSGFVIQEKSNGAPTCLKLALNALACGDSDKMVCGICNPEPPSVFKKTNRIFAGALFVAIETTPANNFSYGKVRLDTTGCITLGKDKISGLLALVRHCLAGL